MLKAKLSKLAQRTAGSDRLMRMGDMLREERGAAAIEFAFIVPFMCFLYFGLIDVTGLISLNRRVVSSASTMADLVGQQKANTFQSVINDQYNAVYVIMQPVTAANVRIEVYDYRKVSGTITQIWKTGNGQGPSCGSAPDTSTMASLMTAGNDLIVARACTTYTPTVVSFLGVNILGSTSFNIRQAISVRPRSTLTLNCYATTVAAGTMCS
ncbi:MAG: pilus assembly protein [Alphaproteobacteria bacterium]|nr:pilus assembly protein [Alphaproteobacteria bacterium]